MKSKKNIKKNSNYKYNKRKRKKICSEPAYLFLIKKFKPKKIFICQIFLIKLQVNSKLENYLIKINDLKIMAIIKLLKQLKLLLFTKNLFKNLIFNYILNIILTFD